MTRWRKAACWGTAGVAILCFAAGALQLVFDSARLTPLVQEKLQPLASTAIHLDQVSLAWLPRPGISIAGVTVANAGWAQDRTMLHIDSLTLYPDLSALLRARLAFSGMTASGVQLNLETDGAGRANWQEVFPSLQASSQQEKTHAGARSSKLDPKALNHAVLSNARVTYRSAGKLAAAWQIGALNAQAATGWRSLGIDTDVTRDGHRLDAALRLDDAASLGQPGAASDGSVRLSWDQGELKLAGRLPLALPTALEKESTARPSAITPSSENRDADKDGPKDGAKNTNKATAPVNAGATPSTSGTSGTSGERSAAALAGDSRTATDTTSTINKTSVPSPAFKLQLDTRSLTALLGWLAIPSQAIAPLQLDAEVSFTDDWMHVAALQARLGQQTLTGDLLYSARGARPVFRASLASNFIDWKQLTADAGRPPPPPVPADEVFYTHDLAWPALVAMKPFDGSLALDFQGFRTRSGIEVSKLVAGMQFRGDQLDVHDFRFQAFGGDASGSLQLDGPRQRAHLDIRTRAISLGQWFAQKTRKDLFSGAPMELTAKVDATGSSMKKLAATLSGPVTLRVGPARVKSAKAEHAETLLTGLLTVFPDKTSDYLDLVCINARLPFFNGVAKAAPIAGARSTASKLLTHGELDLRRQTIRLQGRLRPYTGGNLGVASITGDVRIDGRLRKPGMHLDPLGTPGALARVGTAILTGGLSLVATAAWDAAVKGPDPCSSVFSESVR